MGLSLLVSVALATGPLGCAAHVPSHLRIQDCELAVRTEHALARSPSLAREVARVAELHGIVYVTTGVYALLRRRDALGVLMHEVGVSGETCVLRISLKKTGGDREVGTLAHELQHAIELLEAPDARTPATIEALFARIGSPIGYELYETTTALAVEARILSELKPQKTARQRRPSSTLRPLSSAVRSPDPIQ
jgi:hypothetical protein